MKYLPKIVFFFYCLFHFLIVIHAGVMHSHTNEINKERTSDGAYNPRDHSHFDESGEHDLSFDHEAIVGSHKEAQEYHHLPPEEAKRRLGILIKKMDINGDDQIDRKELKAWIIRSFKTLSEEEAKERLEDADDNNDGIISWKEYLADTYGIESDETPVTVEIAEENDHLIQEDKTMWDVADVNKDGVLDSDEWLAFSHPEEHPSMLPIILQQTLNEKDKDKDGSISFQEYISERGVELGKDSIMAEKVKFDDVLDKNHDGKLEGNEILSWVVPSNEEIAEEEVDHLFAHSDIDHDDILSFQEILDDYETFVGSEATDYGDHLQNIHTFDDEL